MLKYGLYLPNFGAFGRPQAVVEMAKIAEASGWDGIFIWDHINRNIQTEVVDPWIALTAVAMATERLVFGPLVTPLARRRPWKLAREAATLDILSDGRLVLGVGLGGFSGADAEWGAFGEERDMKVRAAMTDEALAILDGLWSGNPFSFEGQHYQVNESQFLPRPAQQPRIPIWVAGYYPYRKPMRRAAKWDGMFILFDDETDKLAALKDTLSYVREQRQSDAPFDAVFIDKEALKPMPERVAYAEAAAEAGATWYIEGIRPSRWDVDWLEAWPLEQMHDYVRQGPPRA